MLSWNQNQFLTVTICSVKSVMQELWIVYTVTQVFFHYKLENFMIGWRWKLQGIGFHVMIFCLINSLFGL